MHGLTPQQRAVIQEWLKNPYASRAPTVIPPPPLLSSFDAAEERKEDSALPVHPVPAAAAQPLHDVEMFWKIPRAVVEYGKALLEKKAQDLAEADVDGDLGLKLSPDEESLRDKLEHALGAAGSAQPPYKSILERINNPHCMVIAMDPILARKYQSMMVGKGAVIGPYSQQEWETEHLEKLPEYVGKDIRRHLTHLYMNAQPAVGDAAWVQTIPTSDTGLGTFKLKSPLERRLITEACQHDTAMNYPVRWVQAFGLHLQPPQEFLLSTNGQSLEPNRKRSLNITFTEDKSRQHYTVIYPADNFVSKNIPHPLRSVYCQADFIASAEEGPAVEKENLLSIFYGEQDRKFIEAIFAPYYSNAAAIQKTVQTICEHLKFDAATGNQKAADEHFYMLRALWERVRTNRAVARPFSVLSRTKIALPGISVPTELQQFFPTVVAATVGRPPVHPASAAASGAGLVPNRLIAFNMSDSSPDLTPPTGSPVSSPRALAAASVSLDPASNKIIKEWLMSGRTREAEKLRKRFKDAAIFNDAPDIPPPPEWERYKTFPSHGNFTEFDQVLFKRQAELINRYVKSNKQKSTLKFSEPKDLNSGMAYFIQASQYVKTYGIKNLDLFVQGAHAFGEMNVMSATARGNDRKLIDYFILAGEADYFPCRQGIAVSNLNALQGKTALLRLRVYDEQAMAVLIQFMSITKKNVFFQFPFFLIDKIRHDQFHGEALQRVNINTTPLTYVFDMDYFALDSQMFERSDLSRLVKLTRNVKTIVINLSSLAIYNEQQAKCALKLIKALATECAGLQKIIQIDFGRVNLSFFPERHTCDFVLFFEYLFSVLAPCHQVQLCFNSILSMERMLPLLEEKNIVYQLTQPQVISLVGAKAFLTSMSSDMSNWMEATHDRRDSTLGSIDD